MLVHHSLSAYPSKLSKPRDGAQEGIQIHHVGLDPDHQRLDARRRSAQGIEFAPSTNCESKDHSRVSKVWKPFEAGQVNHDHLAIVTTRSARTRRKPVSRC